MRLEIAFFLGLPEVDITAQTSIGDFAAVLQGAAGTGKTSSSTTSITVLWTRYCKYNDYRS